MAKLVFFFTTLSLTSLLSSSSFFLFDYLDTQFISNNYSESVFLFARKTNHPAALIIEQAQTKPGSDKWLLLNKKLAKNNSQAAFRLANWYYQQSTGSKTEQNKMLIMMWLKQAIRLGSMKASMLLSKYYYEEGNYQNAYQVLSHILKGPEFQGLQLEIISLHIKIAIALGEIESVKHSLTEMTVDFRDHKLFNRLLEDIKHYQIIKLSSSAMIESSRDDDLLRGDKHTCLTSIQLFATTLAHLLHIDKLLDKFYQEKSLSRYTCFPKPRYINVNMLRCHTKPKQAITCDETFFESIAESTTSRHIGLMMGEGGANVHFGILYFDKNDDVNVFSHEISHLLGFVDEYPLNPKHQICQRIQRKPFAHNIAVIPSKYKGDRQTIREKIISNIAWGSLIADTTPILQKISNNDISFWQLGTPDTYQHELGIFIADTCNKVEKTETSLAQKTSDVNAYKPLREHTHLQYFTYDFSIHYDNILAIAPEAYIMPSFHYNIALAYSQIDGNVVSKKLSPLLQN